MKTMIAVMAGLAVWLPVQAWASGGDPAGQGARKAIEDCGNFAQVWDRVAGMAESLIEMEGTASVIRPGGQREDYRFGQGKKIRLKNGGAKVELRLVAERDEWDQFLHDFIMHFHESGPDAAMMEKALEGIRRIDDFGALQIRGVVFEPAGTKHEFAIGNAADESPKRLDARMQDGGVVARLRMAPGQAAAALMGLAAVQAEIGKPPGSGARKPESAGPIERAMSDPDTLEMLSKGMQDPAIQGMINEGLSDPETRKLAENALQSDLAQGLLSQLLPGGVSRPAEPEAVAGPPEDPRDAEIRQLKLELERQRVMLERILEKLEAK